MVLGWWLPIAAAGGQYVLGEPFMVPISLDRSYIGLQCRKVYTARITQCATVVIKPAIIHTHFIIINLILFNSKHIKSRSHSKINKNIL